MILSHRRISGFLKDSRIPNDTLDAARELAFGGTGNSQKRGLTFRFMGTMERRDGGGERFHQRDFQVQSDSEILPDLRFAFCWGLGVCHGRNPSIRKRKESDNINESKAEPRRQKICQRIRIRETQSPQDSGFRLNKADGL